MEKDNSINEVFKDNLNYYMSLNDISQVELAERLSVTPAAVNKWTKGQNIPRMNKVDKLCSVFGCQRSDLLLQRDATETESLPPNCFPIEKRKFPLLGNIACGEPIFANEDFEGYVEAGADIDADFCLRASGDSMIGARIHDGDIVFIKQQPTVDNGQIAAVLIENEATLKRFYYDQASDTVQLVAENPSYAPIVKMKSDLNDIRILGRAIAFQSIIK